MGALLLGMVSCSLDREPETTLTDAAFWKTEGDLRAACNRLYQQMTGQLGGYWHDYRADDMCGTSPNSISNGQRVVPSESGDWTDPYWRIYISNNILQKAPKATVTEEVLNKYLAEARFFRAFHYFELVKKYGDVPLLLKAIDNTADEALTMPRTPREEVIQQCYADLEFAAEWLPAIDKVSQWGHVSRSAALAMIVRVGLYEGTYSKYHSLSGGSWQAHLQKAISAAQTMISEGKHELYPDFQKLFLFDGEGRQNKENVFVKTYGPNGQGTTTHNNSRKMENEVTVTRSLVDMFLYTDGLPMEKSPLRITPETAYMDVFANRDPRMAMTLYQLDEDAYKGAFKPFAFRYGYNLKKGFDLNEWTTNSKETIDKMVIRYAEVLISYAEALYELNGKISDEDLNLTVNALRRRVGMPAMLTNSFVTTNGLNMLEEIRRERTIEFIDENKRYDDIIRWKIAEKVLPVAMLGAKYTFEESGISAENFTGLLTETGGMYKGQKLHSEADLYVLEVASTRTFDPSRDYLYPIPLKEITLSGGNIVQNPNWN